MTTDQINALAIQSLHEHLARFEVRDAHEALAEMEATLAASLASRTGEPEYTDADVVASLLDILA